MSLRLRELEEWKCGVDGCAHLTEGTVTLSPLQGRVHFQLPNTPTPLGIEVTSQRDVLPCIPPGGISY